MLVTIEMLKPLLIITGGLTAIMLLTFLTKKRKNPKVRNAKQSKNNDWSIDLLMSLEWKRYEEICKEFLAIQKGELFNVNVTKMGADGGIDLKVTDKKNNVVALGQCKAYNSIIGVAMIRELYGVMASEKVEHGYFFTTSAFSAEAIKFAKDKITLINGRDQIKIIKSFKSEQQKHLLALATNGDYTTPTCSNCDKKMVKRNGEKGEFWGCLNYPKCKNVLQMRKS
jgi:restriction system protein